MVSLKKTLLYVAVLSCVSSCGAPAYASEHTVLSAKCTKFATSSGVGGALAGGTVGTVGGAVDGGVVGGFLGGAVGSVAGEKIATDEVYQCTVAVQIDEDTVLIETRSAKLLQKGQRVNIIKHSNGYELIE